MWQRSVDLTGSWRAFAAWWHGLLLCTRSPCQQRSIHKKVFWEWGGAVFLKPWLLLHHQPSARPLVSQSMVMKYLIIFCQCLHPGTQGAMTSAGSQGSANSLILQVGKPSHKVAALTHLQSHTKSAGSLGWAVQTSTPGPHHRTSPPVVGGSASPLGALGCRGSSSPQQGQHVSPHCGALLGCSKESPSARAGVKTHSGDWWFFGRAVPRQCSQWPRLPHHHHNQHSPKRSHETWGGHGTPIQGVNPHLAGISSTGPHQVPSSLQALPAALQHGFAGKWARGALVLLEESKCLSDKVPEGRQAPGALGFPLSPGVHTVPPCPGLSG